MGGERLYRIGEAAEALCLKTCVLRFWETEFPQLVPVRTPKGQRLYNEATMELLRRIRSLLHDQGMTIAGARRVLEGGEPPALSAPPVSPPAASRVSPSSPRSPAAERLLQSAVSELEDLRLLLQPSNEDQA